MQIVTGEHRQTSTLALSARMISFSADIRIGDTKAASPMALALMSQVAESTKLSPIEKSAIIRIAAFIDEKLGGDPYLMKQLGGVVKLMEMTSGRSDFARHNFKEIMEHYLEARSELAGSDEAFTLSINIQIRSLVVSYRGVSVEALEASLAARGTPQPAADASGTEMPLPGTDGSEAADGGGAGDTPAVTAPEEGEGEAEAAATGKLLLLNKEGGGGNLTLIQRKPEDERATLLLHKEHNGRSVTLMNGPEGRFMQVEMVA